jgi:hypothetical protein
MANTVTSLSYANTFGEWVVATNNLIRENNDLAANDYIKSTGTLYLNETTQNALQSNGTVIIQKELLVQGTGSSATVQNNLNVGSQLYLTNGTLSLVASGQANVAGQINGQASGIGLFIANNAHIGGTTVSAVRLTTGVLQANSSVNTSNASIVNTLYTKDLQANSTVNTATASVTGTTFTNVLQANTSTNTSNASIVGTTYTGMLQANTSTNTATASVTGTTFTNVLQANTSTNTATASVTGTTFTNILQANTSTNTGTASITGTTFTGSLQANTSATVGTLQANTSVNTATASITGTTFTDTLQANTTALVGSLRANSAVNTNSLLANTITVNNIINGNSAAGFFNSLSVQGGGLTVGGDFVITGTTVYTSNTFLLSANVSSAVSSYYNVDRGSSGVDAAFRWNEPAKYWDILNVTSNTYFRVLTDEYFNDTLTSTSTTSVATANSVNALNTLYNTSNTFLQAGVVSSGLYANGAFLRANAAYNSQNTTGTYANNAYLHANSAYGSQNTTGTYANSAYSQANTATNNAAGASLYANGAFVQANAAFLVANTPTHVANSAALYANGSFAQANAGYTQANTATTNAATADSKAVTAGSYANSAYAQANTATNNAAGASLYANGAFIQANAAFLRANTPDAIANSAALYANGAFVQANAAFTTANSALNASNLSSGTVPLARLSGITTTQLSASAGITNAQLANNTISGVQLGGTLLSHTAGSYLVGNTYNGSTAQTWSVNATTTNTAGAIAARDGSGDIYATVFRGLATSANYADLAEKYTTPEVYPVGTVVVINTGDESEGIKSSGISQLVLGVVSEKPAFLMNTDAPGQPLALRGRVPVRVRGPVKKGQTLVSFGGGTATVGDVNKFAQALETNLSEEEKLVEAVIL